MPRPNKPKCVGKLPVCQKFVPASGGEKFHEILLHVEEYETLRLIDYQGLTQEACAEQMKVGRATVQAMYTEARKKLARFLVEASVLRISGGSYVLKEEGEGKVQKGRNHMKIAVTYENGEVFQHFGHTEYFKVYDTEDGKILSSEVISADGFGHGALAGFLKDQKIQVLICGGIGGGARNALAEEGIRLFPGACGNADAQVEAYLAGSLEYDPDTVCSHHHHEDNGNCSGHGHGDHCGGHCGH